mmetsp:Transcript_20816/g.32219  ORF Transcript_20816/g.32219 Transcript_20816/m.32219 type:complete len:115 (+) Transcript_20816:87-431(+)
MIHQHFIGSSFLVVPLLTLSAISLTTFKLLVKFIHSVATVPQENPFLDAAGPVFKAVDKGLIKLFGSSGINFKFTDVVLCAIILAVLSLASTIQAYLLSQSQQDSQSSKKKKNK